MCICKTSQKWTIGWTEVKHPTTYSRLGIKKKLYAAKNKRTMNEISYADSKGRFL